MKKHKIVCNIIFGLLFGSIILWPNPTKGQDVVLAGNYDGTHFDLSYAEIGFDSSGHTSAWGANFTVAGSGDFNLTQVIMPLFVSAVMGGTPNPANYQMSVVSDNAGQPTGDLVGSFTPGVLSSSMGNYAYDITGVVHGGANYWLLFQPIAPDSGNIGWNLASSPMYPGTGYVAERWSDSGVPTMAWAISGGSGSVQSAFLLEGTAVVPEPSSYILVSLGLMWFMFCRNSFRKTTMT